MNMQVSPKIKQIVRISAAAVMLAVFILPVSGEAFFFHKWEKNVTRHGIEFKKLRDERGRVIIGYMKKDTVIDGFPCGKGWIHFNPDWSLQDFYLNKTMTIAGNTIPKGTWVSFNTNGEMIRCAFPDETMIQGFLCDGSGGPKGIATAFYPDGKLKSFYPPKTVTFDGIPCKRTLLYYVGLHENGRVRTCKLARDTVIDGITYRKNSKITFDDTGKVLSF